MKRDFTLPNGYKSQTTFYMDFTIADAFGVDAIKDTFNRAFKEWKDNVVYLTELVIVLNMKCWDWHEKNENYSELYGDLYYQARDYALDNLKGEDFDYYYKWTD